MRLKSLASPTAALAAVVLAVGMATHASGQEGGRPLSTTLSGAAEKPNPGDPDGAGSASLRLNVGQSQVCYDIKVSGIGAATMAHIHKAPPTAAGPVSVPLKQPAADGKVSACTKADQAVIKDILQNPGDYYVNVHNAEYPAGAVRGQLTK